MDWTQIIITLLTVIGGGGMLTILARGYVNGKLKHVADADQVAEMAITHARELVKDYKAEVDRLQTRVSEQGQTLDEVRQDQKAQARAIENLNAQNLRFRLVISILILQLRQLGYEPVIEPSEICLLYTSDAADE